MHRRHLLRSLAGWLLLPAASLIAQDAGKEPAPAMPSHHGLPRPVLLGDGIELVDYRVYPSPDVPRIIGEIVNTGTDMVDAPAMSMVFPDLGDEGLAYAPPFLPVIWPGRTNLVFGVLPGQIDSGELLSTARFGLCTPAKPAAYSKQLHGADLRIAIDAQHYKADSLTVSGTVHNAGTVTVHACAVNGMVRDHNGRYAGVAVESVVGDLAPGATKDYYLWSSTAESSLADPFLLLGGDTGYSVEIVPGVAKPITLPGCPAALTWTELDD